MNNDFKVIDDTLYSGVAAEDIIQRRKVPNRLDRRSGRQRAGRLEPDFRYDGRSRQPLFDADARRGLIAIVGFIKAGVTFTLRGAGL